MSKNTGGPAFPGENCLYNKGMTLRDYFAAKALQGFLTREDAFNFEMYKQDPWRVAVWSYEAADAMIKAREKQDE